ncbi:MAG: DUF3330 domain-containing protein [Pseudomonadota bacterium]|jgi:hypothetical protein
MDSNRHPMPERVTCEVCLKEVPLSAAVHFEAQDYVVYFCGLECYVRWHDRREDAPEVDE